MLLGENSPQKPAVFVHKPRWGKCRPTFNRIVGNSHRSRFCQLRPSVVVRQLARRGVAETCLLVAQNAQCVEEQSTVLVLSGMGR